MPRFLILAAALLWALPASAQQATLSPEREQQLRTSVLAAQLAPDFKETQMQLEVYRTLQGVGVTLSSAEAWDMSENARKRGFPGEAVAVLAPLIANGDEVVRENRYLVQSLQEAAARDRAGELERSADAANLRTSGLPMIFVADGFAGQGDYGRAIELYLLGLAKGQPGAIDPAELEKRAATASKAYRRAIEFYRLSIPAVHLQERFTPTEVALARLKLGIAQFKLNQIDEARVTWSAIDGSDAVEILAKVWIDLADSSAD